MLMPKEENLSSRNVFKPIQFKRSRHKLSPIKSLSQRTRKQLSFTKKKSNKRILINPEIDMVSKLDSLQNGIEFTKRREAFKLQKNIIDSNPEISLKRSNTNKEGKSLLREKAENLKKMENKEFERRSEQKLNEQINLLKNKREEYERILSTINKLYEDNNMIDIELKILENYNVYIMKKNYSSNSRSSRLIEEKDSNIEINEKKGKLSKEEIFELKHKEISNRSLIANKKNNLIETKEQNIHALADLKKKSEELLTKIKKKKQNVTKLRKELSDHYHLKLYEGLDFRSEGLISLIKSIWNIGMDVDISFMPPYLDRKCVEFLFSLARDSIVLTKARQLLEQVKKNFSQDLNLVEKDKGGLFNINFFTTRLNNEKNKEGNNKKEDEKEINCFTKKIMMIQEKKKDIEESKFTIKSIWNKLLNRKEFPDNLMKHFTMLEESKYFYKKLEKEIEEKRKKEIMRISKEFLLNDYAKKFNVGIETVLAAICGENGKNSELVNYHRLERNYSDKLKLIKYYSSSKNDNL